MKLELDVFFAVLLLVVVVVACSYSVFAAFMARQMVSSSGVVAQAGLGVYSDPACSQSLSFINWGVMTPGSSENQVAYVKNLGNLALSLSCSSSDWYPSAAQDYIAVPWDGEGKLISPGQVLTVTFTLIISPSVTGITSFSFNYTISGSQ